jgi:hypothetical protein
MFSCITGPAVLLTVDITSAWYLNGVSMNLIPAVEKVDTSHSTIVR